ncbi:Pyridoxamine 5'-phosphate oxidase family protein ustO (Ustiloxin B biosynthesis protein O), partial [Durusdinium trenchii]
AELLSIAVHRMGKTFECLSEQHIAWLKEQRVFFVATAADKGHVNVSPKGYVQGTFAILSPKSVAYLDFTGSGAETVAHSLQNGRITLCFVAFKGDPVIMRLYGTSKVVPRAAAESFLPNFEAEFTQHSGFRAVIVVDVHRVQGSCGFSIPIFDYVSERDILKENFAKKDNDQANDYRILKNSFSIDLLPSIGHRILNNKAPLVAARFKEGFWFGYKDMSWPEWIWSSWNFWSFRANLQSRDIAMMAFGGLLAFAWFQATSTRSADP